MMPSEPTRGEFAVSFLADRHRTIDFRGVPSIRQLRDAGPKDGATALMDKALAVLQERGWTKVRFKNGRGNVCLLGALRVADGRSARWPAHRSPAYREAVARLNRLAHDRGYSRVTFFNDDPGTGYQDVVALVERAMAHSDRPPVVRVSI